MVNHFPISLQIRSFVVLEQEHIQEEKSPQAPWKRWGKLALKLAITIVVFYLISQKLDWKAVWELAAGINPLGVLFALLIFALSKWLGAMRLQHFWRACEVRISNGLNNRLYILSMFYNLILPGGIGGDGYKVYYLNRHFKAKVRPLTSAALLDRANGLALLIVLVLAISPMVNLPWGLSEWLWLCIPVVPAGYWLGMRLLFKRFTATFWRTTAWSAGVQIGQAIVAVSLLWALGIRENVADYVFILMLSAVVLVVPIPSFGGLGMREWVMLFGAEYLGLDEGVGVTASLATYLVVLLVSMTGVWYHFRPGKLEDPHRDAALENELSTEQ